MEEEVDARRASLSQWLWLTIVIGIFGLLGYAQQMRVNEYAAANGALLEIHQEDQELISTYQEQEAILRADLARANRLIALLFGRDPEEFNLSGVVTYEVKLSFYSLSKDETDEDPLMAAFGPSKVFMAALSRDAEALMDLKPGDLFAVVSEDGEVRAVCRFWDRLNQRIDGLQVDIVSPHKQVAKRYGVKDGQLLTIM